MRVLAPASLVVFAIVFLIVVVASLTGGDSSSSTDTGPTSISSAQNRQGSRAKHKRAATRPKTPRGYYVVRAGDNLFTIATRTGVPIETLRQLNPSLDPQALVTGERVKLPTAGSGATGASGATGSTGTAGPG